MFWDSHMHSNFSGDSEAKPIEMINVAREKGLPGITFTDHLDLEYPKEFGFFDLDIANYYDKQHELALKESTSEFTILTGIEVGLQPQVADKNNKIVSSKPYDYVIGSTHLVDKYDPYFESFWKRDSADKLLKRCYEQVYENINAYTNFDSLGHLDYPFRYVNDENLKNNCYEPYKDVINAILERIISLDKALEINTAALRKGMTYPNPHIDTIKRYRELGGKLITIGADAHTPADIAADFDTLPELLHKCGFNEYVVYKKRKPEAYPL
ncbi:histidinol-phosphatase (PHP family) [Pseudobutyrivibrio sp. ACV-2]|uniref:histidinol-phosphatase HisJ family protein n=1 Tax=Pseudobutyrivibrio sp. ACV-2 TaxID=1520801 RepID=UPI0008976EBB|nr:histidinol-phosphatase HisJ family protein [Pseudobutyrivibrio sp. ACV-2]SEA56663.1 histidinol-phosphatase (PHP family) [Pseudobutyrivibrio sp. ACV-2]